MDRLPVRYAVYNFISEDPSLSSLFLHLDFANDILSFIHEGGGRYKAEADISVEIFDRKDNFVQEAERHWTIEADDYAETNSRHIRHNAAFKFDLPPGKYRLLMIFTDHDTRRPLSREKKLELKDFSADPLSFSTVAFADSVDMGPEGELVVTPNLSREYRDPSRPFLVYYELYAASPGDSVALTYRIIDSSNETRVKDIYHAIPVGHVVRDTLNIQHLIDEPGTFSLKLEARQNGAKASVREDFRVLWRGDVVAEFSISTAVRQLRYVVNDEYRKLFKHATIAEQEQLFEQFWRERDPTPGTEANELKDEYFKRIDFANRNFSAPSLGVEGWESDRGRIYVTFGPPTDIEHQPETLNTAPVEVWYYEHLNRRFYFVDRSARGEYRLVQTQ